MPSTIGLYYPFIHFRDERWLRAAALYWPEIQRIVPYSDSPDNSVLVRSLLKEEHYRGIVNPHGVIRDARPEDYGGSSTVGQTFADFLKDNRKELRERFLVTNFPTWPDAPEEWQNPRAHGSAKLAAVFYDKMPERLRERLLEDELAVDLKASRSLGMHHSLAFVYMLALAEHIASRSGAQAITDSGLGQVAFGRADLHRLLMSLVEDRPTVRPRGEVESLLVSISLKEYVPQKLDELTGEEILELRAIHGKALTAYRSWTSKLVSDSYWLEGIEDSKTLDARLHEIYKDHIAPKIQEAEETFRAAGWISTASALAVSFSVPPVLEKLDKFLEVQPNAALATLAGVVLGITKVAIDAKKASEKKPEASFLLAVKKQDAARARVDGADYAGHALFAINEAANALYKVR